MTRRHRLKLINRCQNAVTHILQWDSISYRIAGNTAFVVDFSEFEWKRLKLHFVCEQSNWIELTIIWLLNKYTIYCHTLRELQFRNNYICLFLFHTTIRIPRLICSTHTHAAHTQYKDTSNAPKWRFFDSIGSLLSFKSHNCLAKWSNFKLRSE